MDRWAEPALSMRLALASAYRMNTIVIYFVLALLFGGGATGGGLRQYLQREGIGRQD